VQSRPPEKSKAIRAGEVGWDGGMGMFWTRSAIDS